MVANLNSLLLDAEEIFFLHLVTLGQSLLGIRVVQTRD
jgi:hypothetical protein